MGEKSKKKPYRWTSRRKLVKGAMALERAACIEVAREYCTCDGLFQEKCVACKIVAEIADRKGIEPGHKKSCPLSRPSNERLGVPDDARCCCR